MSDTNTRIEAVQHSSKEEAANAFVDRVLDGVQSDVWMGVMFQITPQGNIITHRTTHNFPRMRLLEAAETLRQLLAVEVSAMEQAPLPVSDRVRMRVLGSESQGAG